MKIIYVTDEIILFNNGDYITFDHTQDCCEYNYADFLQIEDRARKINFNYPIIFEKINGKGFRFGNKRKMFFIPCYSEQIGYYSSDIQIYYYNSRERKLNIVLDLECKGNYILEDGEIINEKKNRKRNE